MSLPYLGVIIVTFNSSDIILDCLESLLAAEGVELQIVVVDNASTDDTVQALQNWAAGHTPYQPPADLPFLSQPCAKPLVLLSEDDSPQTGHHNVTLLQAAVNGGFAAGVNIGLAHLARDPAIDRFWILNPDCVVPPGTAEAFATAPAPETGFSLMGGRVVYLDGTGRIQTDGGTINTRTGVTGNLNQYAPHISTPLPNLTHIHFICGASMVASRAFYLAAGPMPEDYFLYYEEVGWALRRGDLPLAYCSGGIVYHRAGTAIGSPTPGRMASDFSLYFLHRGRMRFMRQFYRHALVGAWAYSLAKAVQYTMKGHRHAAGALLAGCRDAPPPARIRDRLSPEAARLAFAPPHRKG